MLSKDIEETKFVKMYEIRVSENGELDTSSYKPINDNIQLYGYKVVEVYGGTGVVYITLGKNEIKNNMLNL